MNSMEINAISIFMLPGKPWGEFYSVEYAGVDPRDGKPMWYDKDGNLTKVYNAERDSKFTGKTTMPRNETPLSLL